MAMLSPSSPYSRPQAWSDVQCPQCGAYGATRADLWRNPTTGQLFHKRQDVATSKIFGLFAIFAFISVVTVNAVFGSSFLWLGLLLGAVLLIISVAIYEWRMVRRELNAEAAHQYQCRRCLHRWVWVEGRPIPRYREAQEIWDDYKTVFGDSEEAKGSADEENAPTE